MAKQATKVQVQTAPQVEIEAEVDTTSIDSPVDSSKAIPTHVDGKTYDELYAEHKTKSAVIRFLAAKGWKYGPIHRFMGIRYQHVRNVMTQPLKKADVQADKASDTSGSAA